MKENFKGETDSGIPERMERLLTGALVNIGQARSILGGGEVAKLLDDSEAACIEAKELCSRLADSVPRGEAGGRRGLFDTSEMEAFSRSLEGKRILILEDEKPVARMLTALLERNGCVVTAVENEALAVIEYKAAMKAGTKFDAVILDLVVGGKIGGVECFEELSRLDPEVKAVLSSGYCESVSREAREKFAATLSKPYTYGELIRTMAMICSG